MRHLQQANVVKVARPLAAKSAPHVVHPKHYAHSSAHPVAELSLQMSNVHKRKTIIYRSMRRQFASISLKWSSAFSSGKSSSNGSKQAWSCFTTLRLFIDMKKVTYLPYLPRAPTTTPTIFGALGYVQRLSQQGHDHHRLRIHVGYAPNRWVEIRRRALATLHRASCKMTRWMMNS